MEEHNIAVVRNTLGIMRTGDISYKESQSLAVLLDCYVCCFSEGDLEERLRASL